MVITKKKKYIQTTKFSLVQIQFIWQFNVLHASGKWEDKKATLKYLLGTSLYT